MLLIAISALKAWRNPHLLRNFRRFNAYVDFFEFSSIKLFLLLAKQIEFLIQLFFNQISIFHYARCNTSKLTTSLRLSSLRWYEQHSPLRRNDAAVASYWKHSVWFDQPSFELQTSRSVDKPVIDRSIWNFYPCFLIFQNWIFFVSPDGPRQWAKLSEKFKH